MLTVYNRYGQRVFVSYNIDFSWDGTFQGQPVPAETYFYLMDYAAADGVRGQIRGDVVVLR